MSGKLLKISPGRDGKNRGAKSWPVSFCNRWITEITVWVLPVAAFKMACFKPGLKTVKERRLTVSKPYQCEDNAKERSPANLVTPYGDIGEGTWLSFCGKETESP